ncbi:aminotransferase class I and II [Methanohalobium evestigatum Z-7303]|uniref:threonine-phosphate decarboxylase n=1 Tax=Methanohalobium evestigatum (strain ATCC BAA-1072 / DSM 3721 / NBRC 107634 / OCM 161 / Z-7303) TaxID=644295 RepID=D7E6B1_METEZ|nr:threonine-phosphate decarboxylase CobD [Methanohalobium evestigatum]ADI73133.1 aminotransferase class I and II [Methanohalobium evestigatum Z-7303]
MSSENTGLPVRSEILQLQPCVHGGLVRETAQKYNLDESDLLDFSASLNPLGTPFQYYNCSLEELVSNNTEKLTRYPDNRYLEFRDAAAGFIGNQDRENIIPGNGSCELIRLVAECVVEKGDQVIIPQPTFDEYELQCRIFGARPVYINYSEIPQISDELLNSSKILFVCNPNNPTGELLSRSILKDLADRCAETSTLLFVDEAFIELSDPEQSVAELVKDNNFVFVMRSLTKSFAIPGIRVGFGVASQKLANVLDNARLSWNMGFVSDVVGTKLLKMKGGVYSSYFRDSRKMIDRERKYLIDRISRIHGFTPLDSSVNYILVDVSESVMDSKELSQRLAARGILVRDCSSFCSLGDEFIRVAVRNSEDTDKLAKNIGELLTEWGQEQGNKYLESKLESASTGNHSGRSTCEYYPCHYPGQDCTFCFCPFYPCEDERTGGQYIKSTGGGKVWSCSDCHIIHREKIVEQVLDVLMDENGDTKQNLNKAWERIVEPLL